MKKRKILLCSSILCVFLIAAVAMFAGCSDGITLDNLSVKNHSLKSEYTVGDVIDISGGKLIAAYSDGSEEEIEITADMVSGFDSSAIGEKSFTVTYQTKSVRFDYFVKAKPTPEEPTPQPDYSHFMTEEDENGNLTITGLQGDYPRELFFPAAIGGKKVVAIDGKTADNKNAFSDAAIDRIEVENGIERIGDNCFYNCTELDEVILPDSITEFGNYVFESNTSLERVVLGNGLKKLPAGTFCRCSTLVRVELPAGLEEIGESAFFRCYAIDEVNIPTTLTMVGPYAFQYCSLLRSIDLPNVELINTLCFDSCAALSLVNVPGAKEVAYNAFANCTALKRIDLPATERIYSKAFYKSGLTTITLSENLTKIDAEAFSESALKTVILPSNLTTIGEKVFAGSMLETIVLPSSLETMGEQCFSNCISLSSVTFDAPAENFTEIPLGAFENCPKLTGFEIGVHIVSIGEGAFLSVGTELSNGAGFALDWTDAAALTSIGGTAFMEANLTGTLTVPDSVTGIGYSAFQYTKIERLAFGTNSRLTVLGDGIARYVTTLKSVKLPAGITELSGAWFNYGGLEEFDIAATKITTIPDNAFSSGYDNLTKVTLPAGCTAVGNFAFQNKSKLSEVSGTGVRTVGNNAFYNCGALATIDFFDTLASIGNNAFQNCKALQTVTLGDQLTTVGNYAFSSCTGLTNVNIDLSALKKIGDYCFSGDTKLDSVGYSGAAIGLELGQRVFQNCSALESITIPEGVSKFGASMFFGSAKLKSVTLNIDDLTIYGSQTSLGWDSISALTAIYVPSEKVDAYKTKFASKAGIIQAIAEV